MLLLLSFVRLRNWLSMVTGFIECLFFCGVITGWPLLVFVLKNSEYFGDQCVNATGPNATQQTDCRKQDELFSLDFTISTFLQFFVGLVNGFFFDRFGTMASRLVALILFTSGALMIAFSKPEISYILFPGLATIGSGGIMLLVTNMQVGNLFNTGRSTIVTLYNGAYSSGAVTFLLVKVAFEGGISLQYSFFFISACTAIHLMRTFFLLPKMHIPFPLPANFTYGMSCEQLQCDKKAPEEDNVQKENTVHKEDTVQIENTAQKEDTVRKENTAQTEDTVPKENTVQTEDNAQKENTESVLGEIGLERVPVTSEQGESQQTAETVPFKKCVLSWFFLWHVIWVSVTVLRHYLFIGTLNPMLTHLAQGDKAAVSHYTNVFAFIQLGGVLCAPWNGMIIDRYKKKQLPPGATEEERKLQSLVLSLFLTSLQCLLFAVCVTIPVLPLQYLTFVLQVLNRSFLLGGNAAFLSIVFPVRYFGKLFGIVSASLSLSLLLQIPCVILVNEVLNGDPLYLNIALCFLCLTTLIHPVYVYIRWRRLVNMRVRSAQLPTTDVYTITNGREAPHQDAIDS